MIPSQGRRLALLDHPGPILEAERRYVYGMIRRRVVGIENAEDLTQATLLSAFRARATYQGGSLRSWLGSIALRQIFDWRRRELETVPIPVEQEDRRPGPEAEALRTDQARRLRVAIGGLSPKLRSVAHLLLAGRSQRDMARELRLTLGTVKSRSGRAYARLRRVL